MLKDIAIRVISGVLVVLILFAIGKLFSIALLAAYATKKALRSGS